jgi:hypothetical protein
MVHDRIDFGCFSCSEVNFWLVIIVYYDSSRTHLLQRQKMLHNLECLDLLEIIGLDVAHHHDRFGGADPLKGIGPCPLIWPGVPVPDPFPVGIGG